MTQAIVKHQEAGNGAAWTVRADERNPLNGNASHVYEVISGMNGERTDVQVIRFQNGPIGEVGVNGLTNEALLAIVADRLEGFQSSKWACLENEEALAHVKDALVALESRTSKRLARGVEGTSAV